MVPAKSRYLILRIIIMPPVISHADRIHMMYVRRPPADTAPPVPDALNQIGINVIRPHQTGFIHDNPLFQAYSNNVLINSLAFVTEQSAREKYS